MADTRARGGAATATVDDVHDALDRTLAAASPGIGRLGHSHTSVAFAVDGESDAVVLVLDGASTSVTRGGRGADVELLLTPALARDLVEGRLAMPQAVVGGHVAATGPVRHYLEIDVVLRTLLQAACGHDGGRGPDPVALRCPTGPVPAGLCALETRDLHKSFGSSRVLAGLDVTIPEGTISVILGPSGTGKSVCLQHVIGLMEPDAGDVVVRGRPLREMSRDEVLDLRRSIGVMFQDGALFSTMSVFDNVAFPLRQHTDFGEEQVRAQVLHQLGRVGLASAVDRLPNALSGGMRKRAGLARALALNPSIVLCDEPDSGLDPVRTALLGDLILERHAEQGGTMLIVTHNVALAESIAEHITVLWRGEVLESGMAEDVLASDTPFVRQFLHGASAGPLGMDA